MNYRQKCKLNGKWAFVKYNGDVCIYASCQNCGFTYPSSEADTSTGYKVIPVKPNYRYCPKCGLKMSLFNGMHVYQMSP